MEEINAIIACCTPVSAGHLKTCLGQNPKTWAKMSI